MLRSRCFAALVALTIALGGMPGLAAPRAAAQDAGAVELLLSAVQLPDRVRYAVVLLRPAELGIANLRVAVFLPPDAALVDTLDIAERTVFLGAEDGRLTWAAPGYAPGEPADAMAFSLAGMPAEGFVVHATWTVADGAEAARSLFARPEPAMVTAAAGEVTLDEGAVAGQPVAMGDTGVRLAVADGAVPAGTTLQVRRPGPEENPPGGVGSPWWCAALAVAGLPEGAALAVTVPARQPLPGGQAVELFALRDGGWEPLAERGEASADGQSVSFVHRGGTVVAGTSLLLQPKVAAPTPAKLTASIGGTFLLRNFENGAWTITVKNTGTTAARQVYVDIRAGNALDLHTIGVSTSGFTCRVVQGVAAFGVTRAECIGQQLGGGQQITVRLNGGITFVPLSTLVTIVATAQDNFPNTATTTGDDSHNVTINP